MRPICLSILCFILLSPLSALARNEGVDVIVTDPFANIHSGAGRGYPIFHIVERGQTIRLLKRRTNWYLVQTSDGKTGWIKRDQLRTTLSTDGSGIDFADTDRADYLARRWEFGFMAGDFSGAQALTNYVSYHFTPNISSELKYTQAFGEFSNSKLISLNLVHQPFPNWSVSPFFTLGSGRIDISPNSDIVQVEDRDEPVLTVGGGFLFYLSRRFILRLEYNDHTTLTTRENNEEVDEWKTGFSIFF